jgi:hypothetical protein
MFGESKGELITLRTPELLNLEAELREAFETQGIPFDALTPFLQDRLIRSFRHQKTLDDDFECAQIAEKLEFIFGSSECTPKEWRSIRHASLFTDIGKTGPADADNEQVELISRLYAIDTPLHGGPGAWTLADFIGLDPALAIDMSKHLRTLEPLGINRSMTMRTFFNLHAGWTADILENEPQISQQTKVGATLHHLLEGVIPNTVAVLQGDRYVIPSLDRPVGKPELWVAILDKYQAAIRRGNKTHEQAIAWLRLFDKNWVALRPYPESLQEIFVSCINRVEALGPVKTSAAEEQKKEHA